MGMHSGALVGMFFDYSENFLAKSVKFLRITKYGTFKESVNQF